MTVSDALAHAFSSPYADSQETRRRLEAFAASPDDNAAIRAAQVLGGAVRVRGRDAVIAAYEAALDHVDWSDPTIGSNQLPPWPLRLISPQHARAGRRTLLDTAFVDLSFLLGLVPAATRREVASHLIRWTEFGEAERDALAPFVSLDPVRSLRTSFSYGAVAGRIGLVMTASLASDPVAACRYLLAHPGNYHSHSGVARLLAERAGVKLSAFGLDCETGGRVDLHGEELAPLLEFLARQHRAVFEEVVCDALDTPWVRPTGLRAAALDTITADEEGAVYAPGGRGVEVRRFGRAVVVAKYDAKSGASLSLAKDEKAAKKTYAKKLSEASAALGADIGSLGRTTDAQALFAKAVSAGNRYDIRRAIAAGADVNAVIESDEWRALHVMARRDAGAVRRILAAGAEVDAKTVYGVTALYLALNDSLAPFLSDSVDALVGAGARDVTYAGCSLVARAASIGFADAVTRMLAAGFDPKATDANGRGARECALASDHLHVVAALDALTA